MPGPSEFGERVTFPINNCTLSSAIDSLFMVRFVNGDQPFGRVGFFRRLPADADVNPLGGRVTRQDKRPNGATRLLEGDGWTAQLFRDDDDGSGWVEVCAISDELAAEVVASVLKQDDPPAVVDDRVVMGFWHASPQGAKRAARQIAAPAWADIRRNYSAAPARAVDELMGLEGPRSTGRLVLLHGPPGTGKSTALRALARAWRGWCQFEYVLDPELLFKHTSYLLTVLLRADEQSSLADDDDHDGRWRLLLLEDCDELIRANAKADTGQALSRLLNITDGLLGEGMRVLVCITTNEALSRLHPAVVRPGRCLANVHVTSLDREEASAWLGRPVSARGEGFTVAELFRELGEAEVIDAPGGDGPHGLYL